MTHRSKKPLGNGDQGYCNEKRPVNVRVDGTANLVELFPGPGDADVYQPLPRFCPSGRPRESNLDQGIIVFTEAEKYASEMICRAR
jgi:hypothetical protein